MADPDPSLYFGSGEYSDYSVDYTITAASGIIYGTNPAYALADFLEMCPQFGPATPGGTDYPLPSAVLTAYVTLASACLNYERWQDLWEVAMGFFIAHYCTLYLQGMASAGDSAKTIASAGMARGIQVSKSVNDVSVSYQAVTTGWESWGSWTMTIFGQQLISMARIVGMGGVYVW